MGALPLFLHLNQSLSVRIVSAATPGITRPTARYMVTGVG